MLRLLIVSAQRGISRIMEDWSNRRQSNQFKDDPFNPKAHLRFANFTPPVLLGHERLPTLEDDLSADPNTMPSSANAMGDGNGAGDHTQPILIGEGEDGVDDGSVSLPSTQDGGRGDD